MNGVIAVRSLLVGDLRVTALVQAENIAAGTLPQGTALPAIALMSIGSVDRNVPSPGPKRRAPAPNHCGRRRLCSLLFLHSRLLGFPPPSECA